MEIGEGHRVVSPLVVKGLVARGHDAPPELLDLALPPVGPGDVRVRVEAAGVCHSDLSMLNGTIKPSFPVLLGHEAAGVVVEVGDAVTGMEAGARVVLNWAPPCRQCWFCLNAEPWLCRRVEGMVSRPRGTLADGTPLHVALGTGAFAEETVVAHDGVVPLPDGVPIEIGALMGCAVLTGVGAVRNTAGVRSGQSVAVFGVGGIGLSAVAGARLAGASPIIAVDISEAKAEHARRMGATGFLPYEDRIGRAVRALTDGRGVDHAFECVGTSATIEAAWSATRRGGRCTVVGVGSRADEIRLSAMEIFHYARTLTSSVFGSSDPQRDIPVLAGLVRVGALDLGPLISHRTDLDGVNAAFDRMRAGEGLRTVVHPNGPPTA
jgi:S-(hydroxymethyl)glutathione dehydrogenase/alcohol dehydrogenase